MSIKFEDYIEQNVLDAKSLFEKTEEYKRLNKISEEAEEALKNRFSKEDCKFILDCFEKMSEVDGAENFFLYFQGYKDCSKILKKLDIF